MVRTLKLLPLALLATSALSCATVRSVETTAAKVFISDEQESQLGLQVKEELEQKQNIKYLDDPAVTSYVRELAGKILMAAQKERPEVKWQVNVIDDPKTVNAFATPGGYLYIYTGLVLLADNEAELAGVLGHEAGHVVGRHSARQMVNTFGLQAVAQLALGKNPNLLAQIGTAFVSKGALLAHSRSEETEADEYGARYNSAAGFDPRGIATFFEKLKAQEGGGSSKLLSWFSDHPATADRISHVGDYITKNNLSGSELGAQRYVAIRNRLKARYGTAGATGR